MGRLVIPVLTVTAHLLGGVMIALSDFDHLKSIGTDPVGAIGGAIDTVIRSYAAMLSGAIGDPSRILGMSLSGGLAGMGGAFLALGPAGGLSGSGPGLSPWRWR